MNVTITTDASFQPTTGTGGFAFWISSSIRQVKRSGPLKECSSAQQGELMAIANALHTLLTLDFDGVLNLYINTDSQHAIVKIKRSQNSCKPSSVVMGLLDQFVKKYPGAKFFIRHVKGHSGKDSPRKYVHDWCDKASRKAMRQHQKTVKI